MLKKFVHVGDATFALAYHPRTGMIYITGIRRHEKMLFEFLDYIKPHPFHVDEWIENQGRASKDEDEDVRRPSPEELFVRHSRVEWRDEAPVIVRRTGPRSKLIYRTTIGDVLSGIKEMQSIRWFVVDAPKVAVWKK